MNDDTRERFLRQNPFMYVALDERGQMHSFSRTVGDALVERGILWRDHQRHWRVREHDANAMLENDPEVAVCDFCRQRPVVYNCDVDDFTENLTGIYGRSLGGWAACATCGELVVAENVEALLTRSANALEHRPVPPIALAALVKFHELFWTHLKGVRRLHAD